jgi:hypothetical protein
VLHGYVCGWGEACQFTERVEFYSTACDACQHLQDLWVRDPNALCTCPESDGRCSVHGYVCAWGVGCKFTERVERFLMACAACNYALVHEWHGKYPLRCTCAKTDHRVTDGRCFMHGYVCSCGEACHFTGRVEGREGVCDLCWVWVSEEGLWVCEEGDKEKTSMAAE